MNNIALIGLGVMGANLALNIADHDYDIALWNYTPDLIDKFRQEHPHPHAHVFDDLKTMIASLEKPRRVLMMVTAGKAVDSLLGTLRNYLDPGDIVVDLGNSLFEDTRRRCQELTHTGLRYYGVGVSGGAEGARHGPAIMVGGNRDGYAALEDIFCAIAAKAAEDGKPCCAYMGSDGAGHFVKMVHNGIEYADMQLIAESYLLLKHLGGLSNAEMAEVFHRYNQGKLRSYLIEITANVLAERDPGGQGELIDQILDSAGQKGTGKWTAQSGLENGVCLSIIDAACNARLNSALIEERTARAASRKAPPHKASGIAREALISQVEQLLYAGKIAAYAQGFTFYKQASKSYGWDLPVGTIASIFRGGCIIRADFLNTITASFAADPGLTSLLDAPVFARAIEDALPQARELLCQALMQQIPVPACLAAVSYFDTMSSALVGANLLQGLRDYFGAHTFVYRPTGQVTHHEWQEHFKA